MLGRALGGRLRRDGHAVVLVDAAAGDGVVRADLRDPVTLTGVLDGADGLFHTAALHGFRTAPPRAFFDTNVVGTWNLLEAAEAAGVDKVVYSSTIGVYGDTHPTAIGPATDPVATTDTYGVTKLMAEQALRSFAGRGMHVVALRYGGFAQVIRRRYGAVPWAWGASGSVVDLTDVVRANIHAMERLPLPRFGYVVAPSGGSENTPYRVDASATEQDLGMRFAHDYATMLAWTGV